MFEVDATLDNEDYIVGIYEDENLAILVAKEVLKRNPDCRAFISRTVNLNEIPVGNDWLVNTDCEELRYYEVFI